MLKIGKKGIAEFAWIFAVIIGGVIIILSVFFAGKLFESGSYKNAAETARNFDSMLNPVASAKQTTVTLSKPVTLPQQTEMSFQCDSKNDNQRLSVRTGGKGTPFVYTIKNKYIFANNFNKKEVWIFGKSFYMPWRIDDLIYVVSARYCFINPPETIEKEILSLDSEIMTVAEDSRNCGDAIKVCFSEVSSTVCNIEVSYTQGQGFVKIKETASGSLLKSKEEESSNALRFFDDSTMYAAIFGPEIYECNMERVFNRLKSQIDLFSGKVLILKSRGCNSLDRMKSDLAAMKAAIDSEGYANMISYSENIRDGNPIDCPLF